MSFIVTVYDRFFERVMYWDGINFSPEKRDAVCYRSLSSVKRDFNEAALKRLEVRQT